MEEITRQINWNVQGWMLAFLYVGAAVAVGVSALRLYRRVRVWRRGASADAQVSPKRAIRNVLAWIGGRGKMRRDRYAAVMHGLILWGFVILLMGTTLVFLEHQGPVSFFHGPFYLLASLVIDLGGVAFLAGLGMALYRRHVRPASRLKSSPWVDAMLGLGALIAITGFVLEAARIGVEMPAFEIYSIAGYGLARALRGVGIPPDALQTLHGGTWVAHAALSVGFLGVATVFFFRHIVVSMLGVAFRPERPPGALRPQPVPAKPALGGEIATAGSLSWKDLLDADACTSCGRCTAVCPATAAGKALDPRAVVLKLSDLVDRSLSANGRAPSALDTVTERELWDCTTCGACVSECPVDLEVFHKIIDMRRELVEAGRVPAAAAASLDGLQQRENPWNRSPEQRAAWAKGRKLPVADGQRAPELVYWIGCAGAYEPDGQSVSQSMVDIMEHAGLDFAVLGSERCTGDPARRVGDEALFQSYRDANLDSLRKTGARKIVTHCPHCLNTFRNEYQNQNGEEFEVVHHSQLLDRLIGEGRIEMSRERKQTITYHDPCYLGRHNGEYRAPRNVVDSLPGSEVVEMERSGRRSLCCGGGGGQMWLRQEGGDNVENVRLREAERTGAGTVATACPFCKIMFQGSSARSQQESPQEIVDVSELVRARMRR